VSIYLDANAAHFSDLVYRARMRALVAKRYGGPDAVSIVDVPVPTCGPRDVRIAVEAASLNPLDVKIREGRVKLVLNVKPPIALGCDVAGVVAEIGNEVTRFGVGDAVYARLEESRMGGFAEQVCARESVVARRPGNVAVGEAASIPLAALTSLQALREAAGLTAGQRVLIHAGAGGVGSLAIQIAKILGLHVTTTTSARNAEFVRGLGADAVVDYTKHEPLPTGLDAVFDTLGTTELESIAAVKPGGVVVGIAGMPDTTFAKARLPWFTRPAIWLITGRRRRACATSGVRFVYLFMRPDGGQLADLADWIEAGKLRPVLHATFPLPRYAEAFAELARGRARGKIVLTLV
jgi:NADPH:quinone reductase-like Zn-dependent oxidoreductase